MRFQLSVFVFIVLAAMSSRAQQSQLPPVPGKVVAITPEAGFHDEPSIAVNQRDPSQVLVAYQVPATVAYSRDGGGTWKIAEGTASTDYKLSGDVVTVYDKRGTAILCYIAFDELGTLHYWAHGATRNGIFIRRSPDGGATWEKQDHAVIAHPSEPGIPFEDKPGVAADLSDSRYAGNLYVGWTQFRLDESVILFSRSSDGGLTWSSPMDISTHHGLPRDDNGVVEGFSAAVGADGAIYAVWADGESIIFTSSQDGGASFAKSHEVIRTGPLFFPIAGHDHANGFPQIGVDPHYGKRGRLYVTWSDFRTGDVGVYCASSDDGGQSWSSPVRVNSDPAHDGTDQFLQWLAVDAANGAVNVIFYDRRTDPKNRQTTVTLARSTDGGKTFSNYAWTQAPFAVQQTVGDYTGLAALNNKVYGAWSETEPAEKTPPGERLRPRTITRVGIADFGAAPAAK